MLNKKTLEEAKKMAPYIITGILAVSLILNYIAGNAHLNLHKKITMKSKFSGDEIIRKILKTFDTEGVQIKTTGNLHQNEYQHANEQIQLGPDVFGKKTVYSVAIGAHEAMHAVDYNIFRSLKRYLGKINLFIFLPLLFCSFFLDYTWLHIVMISLYVAMLLFKLWTETFDEMKMNRMAYNYLKDYCSPEELKEVKRVYRVNTWTYITNAPYVLD